MPPADIQTWLKKKKREGILFSSAYAALTIFGGAIFLALTFCLIFMAAKLVLLILFSRIGLSNVGGVLIALIVSGLIFADSLYASRDDMTFLPVWLLREYVDIGPRLIIEGFPDLKQIRNWMRFDMETNAQVLTLLATRSTPTFRKELKRIFPQVEWARLYDELRLIDGVIFFHRDENRVILTLRLRLELSEFRKQPKRVHIPRPEPEPVPEPEPIPVNEPQRLSPAEILGVIPGASLAEIKLAYRVRIKECHPDRFANMDEQSRALAEEWTKSLNAAYEALAAQARAR